MDCFVHYAKHHSKCFKCQSQSFKDKSEVLSHIATNHDEVQVKCEKCDHMGFYISSHLIKIHNQCYTCSVAFKSKSDLQSHRETEHAEKPSIKCTICDLSLKNNFFVHYAYHHSKCFKCQSKSFEDKTEVLSHISTNHHEVKVNCKKCDYMGFSLSTHLKQKHNECTKCSIAFESFCELQSHYKMCHEHKLSDFKLPCDVCGKQYLTKTALQQHVNQAHLDIKRHFCDLCQKGFYFKVHLKDHMENVHERKHEIECEVCKVKVQSKYMKQHMKSKHEEKYESQVQCNVCDKTYSSNQLYLGTSKICIQDRPRRSVTFVNMKHNSKGTLINMLKGCMPKRETCLSVICVTGSLIGAMAF